MEKINKARLKFMRSLQNKKGRQKEGCFLVEGEKGVGQLLASRFETLWLAATPSYLETPDGRGLLTRNTPVWKASSEQLAYAGSLRSNRSVIAVARQLPNRLPKPAAGELLLVLDNIRDPGNLGTIVRTADWFGVHKIVASWHTVAFYNPKVIAATMGSFAHVQVGYTSLADYLGKVSQPVYGLFLEGSPLEETRLERGGIVVVGNESQGISAEVARLVSHRITILGEGRAESLNAAIATGILLHRFGRRTLPSGGAVN